jgi:hypothetical protein
MSEIPNDWHDATPAALWRLNEEYETASVEFTTAHGKIWWNGSLKTEASIAYSEKQLKKCGWNGDWAARDVSTNPVRILVGLNEKNGKQEVKAISAAGDASQPRAPKDPAKAASLVARLKARSGGASSADPFGNAPVWDGTGREPGDDL